MSAGKGFRGGRPVDLKKYGKGYTRIFRKNKSVKKDTNGSGQSSR